jgi:ribose-phosphate pyrophosphokinase
MDLHAGPDPGLLRHPVDNLFAAPLFGRDIQERFAAAT